MNRIKILKMEYVREFLYYTIGECEEVNIAIDVEFKIGTINSEIRIPTNEVEYMDEQKVKEYIFGTLNNLLERKFIDEI